MARMSVFAGAFALFGLAGCSTLHPLPDITEGAAIMDADPAATRLAEDYTAAWNSGSADAVASFYSEDGQIIINRGEPWIGRAGVRDMAAGFFADVPDLRLTCDGVRVAGSHMVYLWTFTGHDAGTGNPLTIHGWEEWDLTPDMKVKSSLGWFDAEDYARQVEGR